jgi:hypothetical protein
LANLVEIKMNPIDISDRVKKLMPLKKCNICSRVGCNFYLWTHYYCQRDWESLGCKNCDNFINKKKAYRGKLNQVYCEQCIENNKKSIIKYNESWKPCVKSFNISKLPEEESVPFKCYICSRNGSNEENYYEVWGHAYCQNCWTNLKCKYHSSKDDYKLDKTKVYKGKNNEILCNGDHKGKSFFSKDISKSKQLKAKVFKCYNCKRDEYDDNFVFFDLWSNYYCDDCYVHLGCKSCDNKLDKTEAYRGKNRDVFCSKCITINYKNEEWNKKSLTQLNSDKKSSMCVCI